MNVKQRLLEFIKCVQATSSPNISVFEKECALSNGYVHSMRKSVGTDALKKIKIKYPELNTIWLLHGEGEMLLSSKKGSSAKSRTQMDSRVLEINEPTTEYHEKTGSLEISILNLTESNRQLAEAFVKQADAQIVQAQANKILAETNNGTMHRLTNSTDEKGSQLSFSYPSFPLLERMAQAGVPEQWNSVEKGLEILGRLMTQGVKDVQDKQR